jgi:small subunit ribosomal protein S9
MEDNKPEKKEVKKTKKNEGLITGTGRRKTAVARVFLYEKKGDIIVNDKTIEEYFTLEKDQIKVMKPFYTVGISHPTAKYSATIKVHGSGKSAQADAIVHGISRALASLSEENRDVLRKQGMLTRDSRMVERKKYYLHKARKAPQYSKR